MSEKSEGDSPSVIEREAGEWNVRVRGEEGVAISDVSVQEQTKAISKLATSVEQISNFLVGGGLSTLLSGYARSQAVKEILGGLAAHDGRNSLDARVLGQNALEITEAVELVFKKYAERVAEKGRDPEIHPAVEPKE